MQMTGPRARSLTLMLNVAAIAALSMPANAQPAAITLPGERLHPESVSITPAGIAYVSSMAGGILKVDLKSGKVSRFVSPGAYGSGAQFGVLADTRHGLVWSCTNDFPGSALSVAGADPGHWLKGFDIKTGAGKVSLRLPGEKPVCNDMAVGPDGALYVTDTGQPRILRWKPGAKELEIWLEDMALGANGMGGGIDGIAFGKDGAMIVTNVRSGALFRITMVGGRPGKVTPLTLSRPLASPDGMRPIGDGAFLLAEGKGTISRFSVQGDAATITTLATGIYQPTGVDVGLGTGWYVQGQLGAILRPAQSDPAQLPFRLVPVTLKP